MPRNTEIESCVPYQPQHRRFFVSVDVKHEKTFAQLGEKVPALIN